MTPQQTTELIVKLARVVGNDTEVIRELLYTFSFMGTYARENNAVPSVRAIAKGRQQGIRVTRRQIANLSEAGLILNSVRGLRAPKTAEVNS